MSKWSSYKEQQQLHEGWRQFLNENTMQIAQEVWATNGGASYEGTLVGIAKKAGLQIAPDPDPTKLVLSGPPEAFETFLDGVAADGISREGSADWLQPYEKGRSAATYSREQGFGNYGRGMG
jgi:hypothetical protein|tara:strand:+ start:6334 stop:6699 length:366 start_codon:yes stop_codon:yes gene_type:complete